MPPRKDHHLAAIALPDALRGDLLVISKGEMDDASFMRGHRLQRDRLV